MEIQTMLGAIEGWLADYIFEWFRHTETAIGLALVMLVTLIVAIAVLYWRIMPMIWRLDGLTKRVEGSNGHPDNAGETQADEVAQQRNNFKQAYNDIDQAMRRPDFLRHAWLEFREALVVREDEPIRNTMRPEFYLNVRAVEASGRTMPLLKALPNYFVGFGLLFTFLGLVAAIYFASEGVAGGNVDQAKRSLEDLLGAATFKFMTSVVGLGASIAFSICYRVRWDKLQQRFDRLCEALEKGMLFTTQDSIALDNLVEQKKQTAQLQRLNTEFAIELGYVLRDRLKESLGGGIQSLQEAITAMSENIGQMNQDALAEMAEKFSKHLNEAAGQEIKSLAEVLKEVAGQVNQSGNTFEEQMSKIKDSLDTVMGKIDGAGEKFNQDMGEAVESAGEELQNKATAAAKSLAKGGQDSADKLSATLGPLAEQIGGFRETVNALENKLENQRKAFVDVARDVHSITSAAAGAMSKMHDAATPWKEVAAQFGAATEGIKGSVQTIRATHGTLQSLNQDMTETSAAMRTASQGMQEAWRDYQQHFEGVDKGLAAAIDQLTTGADAYRKQVKDFVEKLDDSLDAATRSLASGVKSLQEAIEDLTGKLHNMPGNIPEQPPEQSLTQDDDARDR